MAVQQDLAHILNRTKRLNHLGALYFGDDGWTGKASQKIRNLVQSPTDARGIEMAVKDLEEKMRLDIKVFATQKMTDEELANLCRTATETIEGVSTDSIDAIDGQALEDIYAVVCLPPVF